MYSTNLELITHNPVNNRRCVSLFIAEMNRRYFNIQRVVALVGTFYYETWPAGFAL